jgi:hypothetical protein
MTRRLIVTADIASLVVAAAALLAAYTAHGGKDIGRGTMPDDSYAASAQTPSKTSRKTLVVYLTRTGAQVTRQAVAQLIADIIKHATGKYVKTSLGVGEPNTNWGKPSFY